MWRLGAWVFCVSHWTVRNQRKMNCRLLWCPSQIVRQQMCWLLTVAFIVLGMIVGSSSSESVSEPELSLELSSISAGLTYWKIVSDVFNQSTGLWSSSSFKFSTEREVLIPSEIASVSSNLPSKLSRTESYISLYCDWAKLMSLVYSQVYLWAN